MYNLKEQLTLSSTREYKSLGHAKNNTLHYVYHQSSDHY